MGSKDSPKGPEQPLPIWMKGGDIEMPNSSLKDVWETPTKHIDYKQGVGTGLHVEKLTLANKFGNNEKSSDPEMGRVWQSVGLKNSESTQN
jgi:hypothetical protein